MCGTVHGLVATRRTFRLLKNLVYTGARRQTRKFDNTLVSELDIPMHE